MGISTSRVKFLTQDKPITVKDFTKLNSNAVISSIVTPLLTDDAVTKAKAAASALLALQSNMNNMLQRLDNINPTNMVLSILNSVDVRKLGSLGPILNALKSANPAIVNQFLKGMMANVVADLYNNPGLLDEFKNISSSQTTQILLKALKTYNAASDASTKTLSVTTNPLLTRILDGSTTLSAADIESTLKSTLQIAATSWSPDTSVQTSAATGTRLNLTNFLFAYQVLHLRDVAVVTISDHIKRSDYFEYILDYISGIALKPSYRIQDEWSQYLHPSISYMLSFELLVESVVIGFNNVSSSSRPVTDILQRLDNLLDYFAARRTNAISTVITTAELLTIVDTSTVTFFDTANISYTDITVAAAENKKAFLKCLSVGISNFVSKGVAITENTLSCLVFYLYFKINKRLISLIKTAVNDPNMTDAQKRFKLKILAQFSNDPSGEGYGLYGFMTKKLMWETEILPGTSLKRVSYIDKSGRVFPDNCVFFLRNDLSYSTMVVDPPTSGFKFLTYDTKTFDLMFDVASACSGIRAGQIWTEFGTSLSYANEAEGLINLVRMTRGAQPINSLISFINVPRPVSSAAYSSVRSNEILTFISSERTVGIGAATRSLRSMFRLDAVYLSGQSASAISAGNYIRRTDLIQYYPSNKNFVILPI